MFWPFCKPEPHIGQLTSAGFCLCASSVFEPAFRFEKAKYESAAMRIAIPANKKMNSIKLILARRFAQGKPWRKTKIKTSRKTKIGTVSGR